MLYWLFLTIPLAWILQNIIHELSHLLVGKIIEGRRMKKLIFWPHKYEGRLYFARYESGYATKKASEKARHLAPALTASILSFLYACIIAMLSPILKIVIAPFFIACLIDIIIWFKGYYQNKLYTDGYYYRRS